MNCETFDAALAAERDNIKRAQADSEGLEIECVFTDEEVVAVIDQLEAAHKREVAELVRCLKSVVDCYDIIGTDPDSGEDYGTIKESAYAEAKKALEMMEAKK